MSMTEHQAKRLGQLVTKARARKALSLRELALDVGINHSWLGYLESGRFLDPAPDRLARVAESLDIESAALERVTGGAVADGLPELRPYFRAKYDLTPQQVAKIERYIKHLRGSS